MTTEFFPEQTIKYKTYAKRTLVEGLNLMFRNHPDQLLQRTKATIEFPKTEADYPSVVVRFFERSIFNAGVGHQEHVIVPLETDSVEVSATLTSPGAVTLDWPSLAGATGYRVYRGRKSGAEDQSFTVTGHGFTDNGQSGRPEAVPTEVTAVLDPPQPTIITSEPGGLPPGTTFYRVTATQPGQAVKFKHYFYNADIEFAVYALSAYDRDLVADSLVQTIAMGSLEEYTNSFFERIYPSNDLFPDSEFHFININSDQIQGFGESQSQTPWGAEDDLLYTTSYRVGVFGELYSLPPKLSYSIVRKVLVFGYIEGTDPGPPGPLGPGIHWVSNSLP
jgi:hypothetical protein